MNYLNDKCPICGNIYRTHAEGSSTLYTCNNEKEIIFAKARRVEIPPYHSFSYDKHLTGITQVVSIQFNLKKNLIVRVELRPIAKRTRVVARYQRDSILELEYLLEPDFPDLNKMKQKLATYINFS